MANKGKRMVNEDLIKQIGQGGGGTEYTAGDGIDITEDVISVDNTVALKTDLPNEVTGTNDGTNWTSLTVGEDTYAIPQGGGDLTNYALISRVNYMQGVYTNTSRTTDRSGDLKTFIDSLPVIKLNSTTDFDTLPNETKIELDASRADQRSIFASGTFLLKDTANNVYYIISTWNTGIQNYTDSSKTPGFATQELMRSGNTGICFPNCRLGNYWRSTSVYTYNGSPITVVYISVTRSQDQWAFFDANSATVNIWDSAANRAYLPTVDQPGISSSYNIAVTNIGSTLKYPDAQGQYVLQNALDSKGMPTYGWYQTYATPTPPTTDGTYKLVVTVAYGEPTFSWVAVSQ